MIRHESDMLQRDCILAVDENPELSTFLRQRYPDCHVRRASTFLSAIEDLSRHNVRAIVAHVDSAYPQLDHAIAGLREAAGDRTRLLLCCSADTEPTARDATLAGSADDYILWPLAGAELDTALGFVNTNANIATQIASPSLEELGAVAETIAHLGDEPYALLTRLADLVRLALDCECATVVADGSAANSGGTVVEPILSESLRSGGRTIGQIAVGKRATPYTPHDIAKLRHYAQIVTDMLSAAQRSRSWRCEALTDCVSGLRNRRFVRSFLDDLLGRARTERFRVTVLLFDIDNFKSYNDLYGHKAGDEIIRQIGQLFQAHCREHDVVTRYGGDEFCVVFWDADLPRVAGSTHPSDALKVLARFQEALKTHRCASLSADITGSLTISGGLASFPWDASTTDELIERADQCLLKAKRSGKNQVFVFGDDVSEERLA